jgi:hypothetical protein
VPDPEQLASLQNVFVTGLLPVRAAETFRDAKVAVHSIKWALGAQCVYSQPGATGDAPRVYMTVYHRCKFAQLPAAADAPQVLTDYDVATGQLFQQSEEMTETGSGWQFEASSSI